MNRFIRCILVMCFLLCSYFSEFGLIFNVKEADLPCVALVSPLYEFFSLSFSFRGAFRAVIYFCFRRFLTVSEVRRALRALGFRLSREDAKQMVMDYNQKSLCVTKDICLIQITSDLSKILATIRSAASAALLTLVLNKVSKNL